MTNLNATPTEPTGDRQFTIKNGHSASLGRVSASVGNIWDGSAQFTFWDPIKEEHHRFRLSVGESVTVAGITYEVLQVTEPSTGEDVSPGMSSGQVTIQSASSSSPNPAADPQ